jgi:GTP-binding protein
VGLIVTMDIRRGMTRLDEQLLRWLDAHRELPVAVLLTKADKLSRSEGMAQQRTLGSALGPRVRLAKFSAVSGEGVEDVKAWIESWLYGVQK